MSGEKKSIIISLLSNLFHYYSFSVYAFSAVILAPIFFHTGSEQYTKILGLLTFSLTFFLKPLGSIVFGHIGDKYGRKTALTYSLVAITIATTCIGIIPSYDQIGWLSSVFLIACLLVQGVCIGGQYTGALVYIQEHTKKENAAFACGLVGSIGVFGALLGTVTSYLFDNVENLGWKWRVPFLLAAVIGAFLYVLMKTIRETPIFVHNKTQVVKKDVPVIDIFKNFKGPVFSAIFISSISISMFYIATVYIPNFYLDKKNIISSLGPLGLVCITLVLCIILMPVLGFVGDRLGRKRTLQFTSVLLISTPLAIFYYMNLSNNLSITILGIMLFSIYASLYAGPGPAFLSDSFPVIGRYSGMGLGIAIGEGLFGGLAPIICVALQEFFNSRIAPASFIMFLGVLSYIGICLSREFPLSKNEIN